MTETMSQVESVCRACIAPFCGEKIHLLSVPKLLDLFTQLSATQVDIDDCLPKSICSNCHQRLDDFNQFQEMCIESYKILLERFSKRLIKIEEIEEPIKTEEEKEETRSQNICENEVIEYEGFCDANDNDDDDKSESKFDPLNDCGLYEGENSKENSCNEDAESESSDDEILAEKVRKSRKGKSSSETEENKSRKRKAESDDSTDKKNKTETKWKRANAYACNKCPKTFMKKEVYEGHMRQHEGLKPFACDQCNKKYSRLERLKNHILNDHSEAQMRFCCDVEGCDKKYRNRETLKRHINSHFNPPKAPIDKSERPVFVCELCGKQLSTKGVLKEHEMMHKGEFPYECDICPRRFRVPNKLYLHKLRHQGIKNFECKICGLKKTTNKELKSHMNVHTREKQYPCKLCNIIFLTNGNLVRHVQVVHDGIKLYACTYCDKAFGKAETLRNHTMKHTGERPLPCPHCERRFISRTSLQYHVRRHEKDAAEAKNTKPEPIANPEPVTEPEKLSPEAASLSS